MKQLLGLLLLVIVCVNEHTKVSALNSNDAADECSSKVNHVWDPVQWSCIDLRSFVTKGPFEDTEEETVSETWPTLPPTEPPQTPIPPPTPPPGPPPPCPLQCRFGGVYRFPHFSNCNVFVECFMGAIFTLPCPPGQVFDLDNLQCMVNGRCALHR